MVPLDNGTSWIGHVTYQIHGSRATESNDAIGSVLGQMVHELAN